MPLSFRLLSLLIVGAAVSPVMALLPTDQNLLVNGSATDPLSIGWTNVVKGGDAGWGMDPNGGVDGIGGVNRTSYDFCTRTQTIDLLALGATAAELDAGEPIRVEEFFRTSNLNNANNGSDASDKYFLSVELRRADDSVITRWSAGSLNSPKSLSSLNAWVKESHEFTNYGPGLRKIVFMDGGKDGGFWSGTYGAELDGAAVYFTTSRALPPLSTVDLLRPNLRPSLAGCANGDSVLKIESVPKNRQLRLSQPDGGFQNVMLSSYFGRTGLLNPTDDRPANVTLAKEGDTLGVRAVLSYNRAACEALKYDFLRIGLGRSGNTRPALPLRGLNFPGFSDDQVWTVVFGEGQRNSAFWARSPGAVDMGPVLPCLTRASRVLQNWPANLPVGTLLPDKKFEAIYSLTRSGPKTLRLYGFLNGVEHTHDVANVSDFTFDSLHLHYPNDASAKGASITLHELMLVLP